MSESKYIIGIAVLMAVLTFTTLLVFPIGSSILNMQLCFFPQYILLFIPGLLFFRHNLLQTIPYRLGIKWLKYTLFIGIPFWFLIMVSGSDATHSIEPFSGHFTWQSAAYSFWESFFCVGICLGLFVWFRDKFAIITIPASFLITHLLRKINGIGYITK